MLPSIPIIENSLGLSDDPAKPFRILVRSSLLEQILETAHVLGAHDGSKKLFIRVSRSFFWPSMKPDIDLFVMTFPVCDRFRSLHAKPLNTLHPFRVGLRGDPLAIDLVAEKMRSQALRAITAIFM